MTFNLDLPNNLHMRHIRDARDHTRFATFNAVCNNRSEGNTCVCLLNHHPLMTSQDFWLVEDRNTDQIVSTICLIPWVGRFSGIDLRIAQLEMVLTHPEYRSRGLVRAQIQQFIQDVKTRDYDLSIIWGIPYYYRQYGYTYALDCNAAELLSASQIPDAPDEKQKYNLRPAGEADIPDLTRLYVQESVRLEFYLQRSPEQWHYLLSAARHPIWMMEDDVGQIRGYAILKQSASSMVVQESAMSGAPEALAFLHWLKSQGCPDIVLNWPRTNPLVQIAFSLGSRTISGGQWLLRVTNMIAFLRKLGPLFENRLAASTWHGTSTSLTINLFRETFRLHFKNGKFAAVDALGFVDSSMGADGGDLCIPPDAFVRLLVGFRTLDTLTDAWPDMVIKPAARTLIETLFPPLSSHIHTPFHYLGSESLLEAI